MEQILPYHYNNLDELELYQRNANTQPTDATTCIKHLDLLVDFIKATYKSTTQRVRSLLRSGEITYDLLWTLFKPISKVYSTCLGSDKPRCITYDDNEDGKISDGLQYYKMDC